MVDWAEELKKKLEGAEEGAEDSLKEVISQVNEDVAKGENKMERLAMEREDLRKRLMQKIMVIKEGMEKFISWYEKTYL